MCIYINTVYWPEHSFNNFIVSNCAMNSLKEMFPLVRMFPLALMHRGSGEIRDARKILQFLPHISLETVFPALKLTQNCYININISFS